jgi:hypothetical protein
MISLITAILELISTLCSFKNAKKLAKKISNHFLILTPLLLISYLIYKNPQLVYDNNLLVNEIQKYRISNEKVDALYDLLEKCNNWQIGMNCYVSLFETAFVTDRETGYILKFKFTINGYINKKLNVFEHDSFISWDVKQQSIYSAPYIIPNDTKSQIMTKARCSSFESSKLKKSHPFYPLIQRMNIKAGTVSYCLGGCTIALIQRIEHKNTACTTKECIIELSNIYHKYFNKDQCYLDVQI